MADLTLRLVKGSPLTNAEVDANFSSLNEAITVGGEPMGHEDRTTSTISFNASTRTFTIAPVSGSFVVWCKGEKVVVSSAQTVVIPNTTGMHSIYYDENGTLSSKLGYFTFSTEAPTAYVYWNATTGAAPYFGDERHGVVLDWQTHEYLHRTRGAAIANGFLASGYTLDSSATDADTQIAIESGTFFDEDMKIDIVSTATPTAGTYQQNLLFPAKIPVLHLQGTSWVMDAPTNFPFKQGTSRPQYNSLSGGVWSTTDVGNHQHATTWILATNNLTYPVIAIIGQSATDNQGEAEAFSFADLTLTGFPSVEFRPLYKLIYKASDNYANNVNAQLVSIVDLRSISAVGSAANPATDHGNLSGLSDDDHPQYLSVDTVRSPSAAVKNSFLPAQSSNNGKFLTTDGTNPSWATMTAPNNGALTLAVSGTGLSGSASFTADQAGNSTFTVTSNATSANTSGAIVARDGSGNFSANVITAVSFTGSASGLTGLKTVNGQSVLGSGNIQIDGGVTSFNTRTGAITLSSGDVTGALGFTPYNSSNPNGYTTNVGTVVGVTAGTGLTGGTVTSSGTIALATSGVTAGTYTKLTVDAYGRATVGASLSSGDVTGALGFTPYNSTNPSGYITSSALSSYLPLSGGTVSGYLQAGSASTYDNPGGWGANLVASGTYHARVRLKATSYNSSGDRETYMWLDNTVNPPTGIYSNASVFAFSGNITVVRVAGNDVLHASNYSSYALPLSGGTVSGYTTFSADVNMTSTGSYLPGHFYTNTWDGSNVYFHVGGSGSTTNKVLNLRVMNNSGGNSLYQFDVNRLDAPNLQINGSQVLHAGNYNSYSPTLTGGNASGTWPISITGNANTASYAIWSNVSGFSTAGAGWYRVATTGSDGRGTYDVELHCTGGSHNPSLLQICAQGDWGYDKIVYANWDGDFPANAVRITRGGGNTYLEVYFTTAVSSGQIRVNRSGFDQGITAYSGSLSTGGDTVQDTLSITSRINAASISVNGNQVLHAGNYNSYALPLSGGTLSGNLNISPGGSSLNLTGAASRISFRDADLSWTGYVGYTGNIGQIDFSGRNVEVLSGWNGTISLLTGTSGYNSGTVAIPWGNLTVQGNIGLHAGNYSSYALPLSGGTITGPTYISSGGSYPLQLISTQRYMLQIRNPNNSVNSGYGWWFATDTNFNFAMHADGLGDVLTLTRSGALTLNGNAVLHASNYSSYALPLSGGQMSGHIALSDHRLYLRTNGDTNHYLWNADDDWEEMVAYAGTGFRVKSSTGTSLMTFTTSAVNAGVALQQGGNQVLHAGNSQNYRSRSLNSARTINVDFNSLNTAVDTFTAGTNYIPSGGAYNQPADGDHHYLSWGGIEGQNVWGAQIDINFYDDRVWFRRQAGANWQAWRQFIHDGNYNSYSPTLTGSGASGTWGINVTGASERIGIPSQQTEYTILDGPANGPVIKLRYDGATANRYLDIGFKDGYGNFYTGLKFYNGDVPTWNGSTLLHAGNYSSYALPLSGGTLTGELYAPTLTAGGLGRSASHSIGANLGSSTISWNNAQLEVKNTDAGSVGIAFHRAGYTSNTVSVTDGSGIRIDGNVALHAGNYSSYALPLSGGVLSGAVRGTQLTVGGGTNTDANFGVQGTSHFAGGTVYWGGTVGSVNSWSSQQTSSAGTHTLNASRFIVDRYGYGSQPLIDAQLGSIGLGQYTTIASGARVDGGIRQGNNLARPLAEWSTGGNSTGMVYIEMPGSTSNYGMVHAVIDVYEYNSNAAATIIVGGHNWVSSWYNVSCNVIGATNKQVRLAVRNGKFVICLGDASSVWEYGTVMLRKIHNASFYNNVMDMGAPFVIAQTNSEGLSGSSGDLRALRTPSSFNANGAITQAGNQVLHAGNYTSYSPSLTGSGASGTWGISTTGYASNLPTLYAGGQQTNPQVYFNENIGLRVAMTGVPSVWSDTLWINGYAGADVPNMCALHTIRNGTPRMWISSQSNRATSYGTMYEFLSTYNYSSYALPLSGGTITGNQTITGTLTVSSGNATGGGIILADDGDIVDLNDAYCSMRFTSGVRVFSANRGGSAVHTLHSNGTFTASGNITAYSDERLKKDWSPLANGFVERLAAVKHGTYTRIDNNKRQAGSSAQDWQQLLPEVVTEADNEEKTLSLAYGNAALVSAIELAKDNLELRARIERLEALVEKLIGD